MKKQFILLIVLLLSIASCQKDPVSENDNIIDITSSTDTLFINANQTAEITVELSEFNMNSKVNLTVVGGKIDNQTTLSNLVPNETIITKTFVPDNATGTAYITATLANNTAYSKTVSIKLLNNSQNNVLNLQLENTSGVTADKLSTFNVRANVTNSSASAVQFTTSKGTFPNGTSSMQYPINGGTALATITTSQEVASHYITCSLVGGTAYETNISFTPSVSYPESIQLVPQSWSIDSGAVTPAQAISFTGYLSKANGKVSTGRIITAKAYQMVSGSPVYYGAFTGLPITSTANEQFNFSYYNSPGLDPNLALIIEVETSDGSATISHSVSIDVTP